MYAYKIVVQEYNEVSEGGHQVYLRHFWDHSSQVVDHTKFKTSLEQSFGMHNTMYSHTLYTFWVKRDREDERMKEDEQNQNFHIWFSCLCWMLAKLIEKI